MKNFITLQYTALIKASRSPGCTNLRNNCGISILHSHRNFRIYRLLLGSPWVYLVALVIDAENCFFCKRSYVAILNHLAHSSFFKFELAGKLLRK